MSRFKNVKPHRLTKPKLLSFIAYTLMLFFAAVIMVNVNPDANSQYRLDREKRKGLTMQWVFVDEAGVHYDLDETPRGEHGSADTFEYLLPSEPLERQQHPAFEVEEIDPSQLSGSVARSAKKAYATLWNDIEDRSLFINTVFEYLLRGKLTPLPEGSMKYVVAMYGLNPETQAQALEEKACLTPWDYEIEHGDSVFAYQQRADAPHVCKIQRRTCQNGKLSGNFTQASCDESLKGNIKNLGYDTYNLAPNSISWPGAVEELKAKQQKLQAWGFIQPTTPKYENADFNLEGKRAPNSDPITIGSTGDASLEEPSVPLTPTGKRYCETPRGEKVRAGQFVKAYRFKNGFTDIPCQAQIRVCVEGNLEGFYEQPTCKPWETSFEDFREGYLDGEEPSVQRLFQLLEKDFSGEVAVSELDVQTARQMADYLRSQQS